MPDAAQFAHPRARTHSLPLGRGLTPLPPPRDASPLVSIYIPVSTCSGAAHSCALAIWAHCSRAHHAQSGTERTAGRGAHPA
eukprot:6985843-Prymnesium_polylepis.1